MIEYRDHLIEVSTNWGVLESDGISHYTVKNGATEVFKALVPGLGVCFGATATKCLDAAYRMIDRKVDTRG